VGRAEQTATVFIAADDWNRTAMLRCCLRLTRTAQALLNSLQDCFSTGGAHLQKQKAALRALTSSLTRLCSSGISIMAGFVTGVAPPLSAVSCAGRLFAAFNRQSVDRNVAAAKSGTPRPSSAGVAGCFISRDGYNARRVERGQR